jgi:hypothetical protein
VGFAREGALKQEHALNPFYVWLRSVQEKKKERDSGRRGRNLTKDLRIAIMACSRNPFDDGIF